MSDYNEYEEITPDDDIVDITMDWLFPEEDDETEFDEYVDVYQPILIEPESGVTD